MKVCSYEIRGRRAFRYGNRDDNPMSFPRTVYHQVLLYKGESDLRAIKDMVEAILLDSGMYYSSVTAWGVVEDVEGTDVVRLYEARPLGLRNGTSAVMIEAVDGDTEFVARVALGRP